MCSDPQARRQHDPVPAPSFLHERLRAADVARLAAVPRVDGAGAHAADVSEDYLRKFVCFSILQSMALRKMIMSYDFALPNVIKI